MKDKKMRWIGVLISLLLVGAIVSISGCISEKEKDSDGDGIGDACDTSP